MSEPCADAPVSSISDAPAHLNREEHRYGVFRQGVFTEVCAPPQFRSQKSAHRVFRQGVFADAQAESPALDAKDLDPRKPVLLCEYPCAVQADLFLGIPPAGVVAAC